MSHVPSDSFSSEVHCSFPGRARPYRCLQVLRGLRTLRLFPPSRLSVPLVRNWKPCPLHVTSPFSTGRICQPLNQTWLVHWSSQWPGAETPLPILFRGFHRSLPAHWNLAWTTNITSHGLAHHLGLKIPKIDLGLFRGIIYSFAVEPCGVSQGRDRDPRLLAESLAIGSSWLFDFGWFSGPNNKLIHFFVCAMCSFTVNPIVHNGFILWTWDTIFVQLISCHW
jgi:hypothetical protein